MSGVIDKVNDAARSAVPGSHGSDMDRDSRTGTAFGTGFDNQGTGMGGYTVITIYLLQKITLYSDLRHLHPNIYSLSGVHY